MPAILIVGLPTILLKPFKALALRGSVEVCSILSALGATGYFRLSPNPDQAVHAVSAYADTLNDFADAHVIVLPYSPLPENLRKELTFLSDEGGKIVEIKAGVNGWPKATTAEFDDKFYTALLDSIANQLFPEGKPQELTPSEYFSAVGERQKNFLIPKGVLSDADSVAKHRYKFMRNAADALEKLASDGIDCSIEDFFKRYALLHAQSGGIQAELEILNSGAISYSGKCHTHLKQGDNTTKSAAARIYYLFFKMDKPYVALLYAGIHPEKDVKRYYIQDATPDAASGP